MKLVEVRISGRDHASLKLLAEMRAKTVTAVVCDLLEDYLDSYDITKEPLQMGPDDTCDKRLSFAPSDVLAERIGKWRRVTGAMLAPLVRALVAREVEAYGREINDYFQRMVNDYLP